MSSGVTHGLNIGKTPLIRLRRLSELTGCEILGKAEFMNPGDLGEGSSGAWHHLGWGIKRTIATWRHVEGTAGNTGLGFTVVGHAKGYRTVIVIPETQSPENKFRAGESLAEASLAENTGYPETLFSERTRLC
jgi:cysteine synthase